MTMDEKEEQRLWAWLLLWAGLAAAYLVTGELCVVISAQVANVSWMLFIPAGLSLASALLWGRRVWPGIFIGELMLGLFNHLPPAGAFLQAVGNGLDAALAGWWFHDRLGRRLEFDRLRDVMQLLVAELLVLQPMSAVIGLASVSLTSHLSRAQMFETAMAWYSANIYAQLMAGPATLVWIRWSRPATRKSEYKELCWLAAVTLLAGAVGPGRWAFHPLPLPVTLILVFPILVWASVRFVPSVAVTVGTVLGLFALDAGLAGTGPFAGLSIADRMVYLNVFMGVSIGTSLFLAAAMGESRRFEAEQARLISELQSAADKVRRLEEFVTFCAWTGRVRWKEEWVPVETFLKERYHLSVTHGVSEEAKKRILAEFRQPRAEEAANPGEAPA